MSFVQCEKCIHFMQETTDDVACCNCCDDGEFFDPINEKNPMAK